MISDQQNIIVAIALPVLNEEKTLDKNVRIILEYIDKNIHRYQVMICIADNGSNDKTEEISRKLELNFPEKVFYYKEL